MNIQFKAINWTPNEKVGEAKMDQMNQNAEWLFKNTPRAIYTLPGGLRRVEGVKVATGRAIITKRNSDQATVEVHFGNFFSVGCQPNITIGVVSASQPRIFAVIRGIGTALPDTRGFQAVVNVDASVKKNDKIASTMYLNFNAMGY